MHVIYAYRILCLYKRVKCASVYSSLSYLSSCLVVEVLSLQVSEPMESPSVTIGLHAEPVTKADAALSDETAELARVRLFHNGIICITITTHA